MITHTLFVPTLAAVDEEFTLPEAESHHLFKVFRAAPGDPVELLDGQGGRGWARVLPGKQLRMEKRETIPAPELKLHLYCAVPRRARQDELLKGAVELGVWSIHPIICARSVSHPEPNERWRNYLQEACKQSKNPFLPQLVEPVSLECALAEIRQSQLAAFFGSVAAAPEVKKVSGEVAWIVGPEGGFTPEETQSMQSSGVEPLNLCPWVLRLETAALAGLAVLRHLALIALLAIGIAGCGRGDAGKNPLMLKGDKYRAEGNYALAENFYLKMWEHQPNSPVVLRALAALYDEALDQPINACFFYDRCLKLLPAEHPDRESLLRCRELVARRIAPAATPAPAPAADARLIEENRRLRNALTELRRQMAEAKSTPKPVDVKDVKEKPAVEAGAESFYTIQRGDSLSLIARKLQVSVDDLRRVNNLAPNAVLHIGRQLRIPARQKLDNGARQ